MAEFIQVAKKSQIPMDTGFYVEVEDMPVALFNVEGKIHALHAMCVHQGGPLHEGGLRGKVITCPWHGWDFDVTSGKCTFNDEIKQPVFEVKVEGDDVFVKV